VTVRTQEHVTALVADRLIDGSGRDPVEQAAVVWEGDRLLAAGARRSVQIPSGAHVIEGEDLTILPGLMDMHVHLGMEAGVNRAKLLMTPRTLQLLHAVPNAAATLVAGFTTVRDAGLTPASVRIAVERGFFPGPRMQVAVSIISQTGGHADPFMPIAAEIGLGVQEPDVPSGVADGIDGMRQVVRRVLRAGADWIKLCTSGGVLSPGDLPDSPQFTIEEIGVAVYEAATHGKRCMAHAMSAAGIKNALRAGVVTIEHGSLLDEEAIALMKEKRAYLVATLVAPRDVIARAEREPQSIPEEMVQKARKVVEPHKQAFRAAVQAGVRIAMGTDTGVGHHGENARELPLMVEGGLTPLQAIVATTRTPAELLGVSDRLGTLEPGKVADVIAVRGDPLREITLFNDRARVRLVVKAGKVVRNELARTPAAVA